MSARARAGIKKRPAVDEDALAHAVGLKLLAHLRREKGLKLHVWMTDDGPQVNVGYLKSNSFTVDASGGHPLVAIERVLDLRAKGTHVSIVDLDDSR